MLKDNEGSSVAGVVVAKSVTKSVVGSQSGVDTKQTDEMKIQQALHGLGFYDAKFDGNLNSIKSRQAINKFEQAFKINEIGIINETNKQHLLYLNELYTSLIKVNNKKIIDKDKRNFISAEIDKTISLIKGGA